MEQLDPQMPNWVLIVVFVISNLVSIFAAKLLPVIVEFKKSNGDKVRCEQNLQKCEQECERKEDIIRLKDEEIKDIKYALGRAEGVIDFAITHMRDSL